MDDSQLLKGVLDLLVLSVLEREDSYGYQVVSDLRSHGLDGVGEASVYGTLRRLHRDGLLETYTSESSRGPRRRNYGLTEAGRLRLADDRKTWNRFVEILDTITAEDP